MNLKRQSSVNIELTFNEFVKDFGGQVVSEIIGKNPKFENADYLFQKDQIVAELKCLQKDFFRDIEYQKKIDKLYDKWIKEGLISPFPKRLINSTDLPKKCQDDIIKIVKAPLKRIVEKANRQIKQTKKYFNLPNAKGVLLLANDGNYSLETEAVLNIATNIIRILYSNINYIAYFTVNMPAQLITLDGNIYVWAMAHGEKEKEFSYDFLHRLGDGWIKHIEKITGIKHKSLNAPKELVEHIKFVK